MFTHTLLAKLCIEYCFFFLFLLIIIKDARKYNLVQQKSEMNKDAISKAKGKIVHYSRALLAIFDGEEDGDVDDDLLANLSQIVDGMCMRVCVCV